MSLQAEAVTLIEAAMETALNRVLRLDSEAFEQLRIFEGKVIALELRGTGLTLTLLPGTEGIQVMSVSAIEPDTMISGTPLALLELGFGDAHRVLFSGEVTIRGDVETGQAFKRLLDRMDIDWEELLSHYSGDIIAHQFGDLVRGLQQWSRQARRALGNNLAEYLQHESRDLALREDVEMFGREVDRLRDDSARLESRLAILQQKSMVSGELP
ncbi:MAG: SCP2 sterol-binding domain-containing protein [Thiohalophilus sp.]|jgi:ubiquinone biosynthesis protein UbiJ